MRQWRASRILILLFLPIVFPSIKVRSAELEAWREGLEAAQRGEEGRAMERWEAAARQQQMAGDRLGQLRTLLALGSLYESCGRQHRAQELIGQMGRLAQSAAEKAAVSDFSGSLALLRGREAEARQVLREGLALLGELPSGQSIAGIKAADVEAHRVAASLWNNLGNVALAADEPQEALQNYGHAERHARTANDGAALVRILINACRAAARLNQDALITQTAEAANRELESWVPSHESVSMHLSLAGALGVSATNSFRYLQRGYEIAQRVKDTRGLSQALGMLGRWHEKNGQYEQSEKLFERAAFQAQEVNAPELQYRWLWGVARCQRAIGQRSSALAQYRQAVESLHAVRYDLVRATGNGGRSSFGESVGDLYMEMVDLLLQEAESSLEPTPLLQEARRIQERLRSAELEDYFRDECVSVALAQTKTVDEVSPRTAVLYVIGLPDRFELLVSLAGDQMEHYRVPVPGEELERALTDFRGLLEKRTTYEYLRLSRQLHAWLMAPLAQLFQNREVDTLIVIPGGALRTVPLAALHDGDHYLVEKMAVAVAPGLTLLGPKPSTPPSKQRILAAGLSVAVPGFDGLHNVKEELDHLAGLAEGKRALDEDFTARGLAKMFREENFSIVHFASHGQFNETAQGTFLVLFDGRLTLDQMESLMKPSQYRGRPVELLGLSACQTAAGSARAGLGMAGLALKAGARSALATLWSVNDEASRLLVEAFYDRLLHFEGAGKAKALQQAQQRLLADPRFAHPAYWSPYLIIGNWL